MAKPGSSNRGPEELVRSRSSGEGGNCIAVVVGAHLAEENVPPLTALGRGDGEFERGLAGGVTEDGGAGEQPPAQRGELSALRLTEPALETDAQVVGTDGEMTGGFGRPERTATQALQTKLGAKFLDAVFDVGAAVVAAPHLEGTDTRRQIGPQRLELVAGHLKELLPAGVGAFADALTQDDEPHAIVRYVLHCDARHLGRRPRGIIVPTEGAHRCAQRRRQDTLQSAGLQFRDHALGAKAAVSAHQAHADRRG